MKTQIVMAIIIVVLFALENVFVYQTGKNSVKAQIIRDTDTVITYRTIQDIRIIPKYTTITKTDTVINSLTDTVYIDNTTYIATLDTTYEDDLAKLKVDFISDIPLSKKSYFNLDLKVKSQTVFVPTYKAYEPDTWGIGAGLVGRFQDSVRVNLFGNISYKIMNYKYFELPITAEIEFGDNLNIVEKTFRIEGRFKF
jgi:hypothetical protein